MALGNKDFFDKILCDKCVGAGEGEQRLRQCRFSRCRVKPDKIYQMGGSPAAAHRNFPGAPPSILGDVSEVSD